MLSQQAAHVRALSCCAPPPFHTRRVALSCWYPPKVPPVSANSLASKLLTCVSCLPPAPPPPVQASCPEPLVAAAGSLLLHA